MLKSVLWINIHLEYVHRTGATSAISVHRTKNIHDIYQATEHSLACFFHPNTHAVLFSFTGRKCWLYNTCLFVQCFWAHLKCTRRFQFVKNNGKRWRTLFYSVFFSLSFSFFCTSSLCCFLWIANWIVHIEVLSNKQKYGHVWVVISRQETVQIRFNSCVRLFSSFFIDFVNVFVLWLLLPLTAFRFAQL